MGSTLAARTAGISDAAPETLTMMTNTPAIVAGSEAETPNSMPVRRRAKMAASTSPAGSPNPRSAGRQ